jgi:hypothetical protein
MSGNHQSCHRRGQPGGPGCHVTALQITLKAPGDALVPGYLLDAGTQASELELLRTSAEGLGVKWGHDDLGWWAAVSATAG